MKAVIIEDENLIAKELQHKINKVAPDVEIIAHLDSVEGALNWMTSNPSPDLYFMDIQLGDGVSFDIFKQAGVTVPVIFTTAYDEYALQAFKVNGVDYLLKPVDSDDLQKAIDKARKITAQEGAYPTDVQALVKALTGAEPIKKFKEKFLVNFRKQWLAIDTRDIALFFRENLNYLVTFNGDRHILDFTTLEEVEALLDPQLYFRANRQSIIHIDAIRSIKPLDNQTLQVFLKPPLEKIEISVGRVKAPQFKKWFDR